MDTEQFGPAMRALDERRQAFVLALLSQVGKPNHAKAAADAGFVPSEKANANSRDLYCRMQASRMMHNDRVLAAINEMAGQALRGYSLLAVQALGRMIANPKHKNHAAAVESVLNRTGHSAVQKIDVQHTDLTGDAVRKEIARLAAKVGIEPQKLLGGNVIEGEFVEVEEKDAGRL